MIDRPHVTRRMADRPYLGRGKSFTGHMVQKEMTEYLSLCVVLVYIYVCLCVFLTNKQKHDDAPLFICRNVDSVGQKFIYILFFLN